MNKNHKFDFLSNEVKVLKCLRVVMLKSCIPLLISCVNKKLRVITQEYSDGEQPNFFLKT